MIEREIFKILKAGQETINEDTTFLRKFFTAKGLESTEIDGIEEYWNTNQVQIIHQYPFEEPPDVPLWAIVLDSEQEDTPRFLGDEAGIVGIDDDTEFGDPEFGADINASLWKKKYWIYTYARLPDIAIYYYELCKFFLIRGRNFLKDFEGPAAIHTAFSGGDLGPSPQYSPTHMFVRRFGVEVVTTECFATDIGDGSGGRGTSVRGIHVNNDVTGVDPMVDPYIEE